MTDDCIFCRIIAGEIPCTKVHETDSVLAFIDIGPIIKGHTLVIPKSHHDPLMDTPDDVLADVIHVVRKIATAQKKSLNADGVNVVQNNGRAAGQMVDHLHFHVIPRYADDGHHWNWNAKHYDAPEEARVLAEQIAAAID